MKKLLLPIIFPAVLLTACKSGSQATKTSRYSTNTFAASGGMMVFTQITDHQSNKTYYYELKDNKGLVLKSVIDLTKSGDTLIPFEPEATEQNSSSN